MKLLIAALVFLVAGFGGCNKVQAAGLADLKFGQAQIADSQWNVSACTQTATCQIYSKNPGTAYMIPWYTGQLNWSAGDYVAFAATGDATNPWNAVQYNSSGTQKAVMGTGHIINMGADYFFFVGNDNDTGQLFSMTSGFSNTSGVTWTGTLNPTTTQVNTYAANGSTTPLAAGQTAPPPPPPVPTIANGTFQNAGASWTMAGQFRSVATGTGHNGSNTLNFGAGNGDVHDTASQTITGLTSGRTYTVTYWVKMGGTNGTYLDGKITRADGSQVVNYTITNQEIADWKQVYLTFTSYGDTYTLTFTSYNDPSINYISDVAIIETPTGTIGGGFVNSLCCGASTAPFSVDNTNMAKINLFINRTTNDAKVYIEQIGRDNNILVEQTGTKNNYVNYYGHGDNNNVIITQHGNSSTIVDYVDLRIVGNSNTVTLHQQSTDGAKAIVANIQDNNNSLLLTQKDSGSHFADVTLAGGNKNVDILQQGSGNHMAKIGLTGMPVDLSLTQSGSASQSYSINFNCATGGGCAKIIVQQGQ